MRSLCARTPPNSIWKALTPSGNCGRRYKQACKGYDYQSMIEAEPAIRQLLKLDFEQKVKETVMRTYRQTVNQTLNVHLLQMAKEQVEIILQQYDHAREYLAKTLEREAAEENRA